MSDENNEPVKHKVLLVFSGLCTLSKPVEVKKGKRTIKSDEGGQFYLLTKEEYDRGLLPSSLDVLDERGRIFGYLTIQGIGRPGTVYEFESDTEDCRNVYPASRKYRGTIHNDPHVLRWQAMTDAERMAEQLAAAEKKGSNVNLIHEQLEPLRQVYQGLVGTNRQVFLAQIMAYLHRRG